MNALLKLTVSVSLLEKTNTEVAVLTLAISDGDALRLLRGKQPSKKLLAEAQKSLAKIGRETK